ncbi:hypothetical protein MEQU1_000010 [Malassezia equina]|uniref:Rabenosyn Rab binding domain-containing protein n=1 Tax=Malassezia equina TaxID=1381935 RepID=A0AAF0EFB6_9BASI|nr:hypothetical protein MEQU1_000010 [Malassezia equina]
MWLRRGSMLLDVFSSKQEQEKHRLQQLRRLAEQDVVKWQDDKNHPNCTLCDLHASPAEQRWNMDMKVSSNNRALQADTMQARKELLASFSRYDQLAKQIVNLAPIVDGRRCSTQKRLQEAVFARANMFLRKHTFASESLPSVKDKAGKKEGHNHVRSEVQEQLRILKEQDILLDQYLEAAKKARNLDDVASLKHNQEEIRQEIKRIQMESAHHDADEP